MFYWIVIVFVVATLLGLNVSKKDDYRDAVLMPKIEPVVSRAVTQHGAAYKYFMSAFTVKSDNTTEFGVPLDAISDIADGGTRTYYNAGGTLVTETIKKTMPLKNIIIKNNNGNTNVEAGDPKAADGALPKGNLMTLTSGGKSLLQDFAPYGFNFANRDAEFDPVTRFICVDRNTGATYAAGCTNDVLNKKNVTTNQFDPDGKFRAVGYLVTYMPIPPMWDTPYYHNMIVNSIKRISDNTFKFGIVKALPNNKGITNSVSDFNAFTGRNYSETKDNLGDISNIGIPLGSKRAIYTVVDEYSSLGRKKDDTKSASNLVGVFTFIPGEVSRVAIEDFPDRKCGSETEKKDVNGMLVFINRITDLESEEPPATVADAYIGSNAVNGSTVFCPFNPVENSEDDFYDANYIFGSINN